MKILKPVDAETLISFMTAFENGPHVAFGVFNGAVVIDILS